MLKTYYCVSLNEDNVLIEYPKHGLRDDAFDEMKRMDLPGAKVYKVTCEIEEINA